MKLEVFIDKIKTTVREDGSTNNLFPSLALLNFLDNIFLAKIDTLLQFTQITILFEAFYRHIEVGHPFKTKIAKIRAERWANHYGIPTIDFLLTYDYEIEDTFLLFTQTKQFQKTMPWEILNKQNLTIDKQNSILIDLQASKNIPMPAEEEKTGQFLKTHNVSGGFTTTPSDPISQKFIEYSDIGIEENKNLLEIGAAFGAASLQTLAKGATVFCNDISAKNLAVVKNRIKNDNPKLILIPGSFPDELSELPKNFFDALLICRVLHFFSGEQIENSLKLIFELLKPNGKLFIVCETPYLKNWQRFIPEHEKRIAKNMKWPGEITNPADYESSGRAASLPKLVHWITKEVLNRALTQAKFHIEHLDYINRNGQFPEDLLLDGRESIGAIAVKPTTRDYNNEKNYRYI